MSVKASKQSYTVPCSSRFRDAVLRMAETRGVNAADLARSVALVVPADAITGYPDPGEPEATDREEVVIQSGKSKGRPWQRKPRLQIRMAAGSSVVFLRKALALALALYAGTVQVSVAGTQSGPPGTAGRTGPATPDRSADDLQRIVDVLAFQPLPGGVQGLDDALYVFGFPPASDPDAATLRARFRLLASILHPDSGYGSHPHMSQLNTAMDLLRRR